MDRELDSALDSLTRFTSAVAEDGKLRAWFRGLEQKSESQRRQAILALSRRLPVSRKNHGLMTSLKLLAAPQVFEAARLTIRSRHY